jgi:hypothetical protein
MCESSLYHTTHPILGIICIIGNPQWSFLCIYLLHHNFMSSNNFSITVMAGLVKSCLGSRLEFFAHWDYQNCAQECYLLKTSYKLKSNYFLSQNIFFIYSSTLAGRSSFVFFLSSFELSLEWLCRALRGGDGTGELPDVVDVGVPPVSLLLLLSVVAEDGRPTYKIRQISTICF